jgi:hypothetical protein
VARNMKKKSLHRTEAAKKVNHIVVRLAEALAAATRAGCMLQEELATSRIALADVLIVRDICSDLARESHELAQAIDPEPAFPNPHK